MSSLEAVRHVAEEIERLDAERIAGVSARGIGTEHLLAKRLPGQDRWSQLAELAPPETKTDWRDVLAELGYGLERLPQRGWLATSAGKPALVIHPKRSAAEFARLDEEGRLPEGALLADCDRHGAPFGLLAAGARMRLLHAGGEEAGQASRYLELDAALIEPESRPLLGLLAPAYLAEGGLAGVLAEARDYGADLRLRIDRALRQRILPDLGRELGRWAFDEGLELSDDTVRADLEAAALTFVFRALFLLYAESAGYLPMSNQTYASKSMTRIAQRAAEELDVADPRSSSLWRDIATLVEAMRDGQTAWGVPPYNGALFAPDGFDGAETLERASIPDAALAAALVALARDPDDPETGVDFSGLEIGHLGHIYEGLLSLRLSVADRELRYDERSDRYVAPGPDEEPDVSSGELLWLTNEGGRKGGGVYYTRSELVRHLVRRAVRERFAVHLAEVRELAERDPAAAAEKLFDFYVLDPACGSAHFLVEVVDELADRIAELLGEVSLPAVRDELESLRAAAGATFGAGIEDAALLKRLVLKRCVFGVDLSPMGAEIAKVSLWLSTFVPGLSLAYLDHNIRVGNSLIGVARPEALGPAEEERGTGAMFGDPVTDAISAAATEAARLREIADRTPDEVEASEEAAAALAERVEGAKRLFDLWTAQPLGLEDLRLTGTKDEKASISPRRAVAIHGPQIVAGEVLPQDGSAGDLADEHRALHWPLAFAEAFARENPGFDVVVGNPPWEEVNVDELTFYALHRPGLRAMPESPRREATEKLLRARPELAQLLAEERDRLAAQRAYLSPAGGYTPGPGNADLYEFFCQRYRQLVRSGGSLGVVLPRSVFLAKGSEEFRRWLFDEAVPRRIDFLLNRRRWAFDTHPQYTVALLAAERRTPGEDDELEVAGVASSAREFAEQSAAPGLALRREALGPGLEVPLLPDQAAADLLA
ncbi:MAG: Eco57I restriction-modification methylase domain-containing protein, partial [Solirubrobacterales bacterium]